MITATSPLESEAEVDGPFRLAASSYSGLAANANADNKVTSAGAVWDVGASIPRATLGPGQTSRPFSLQFRYPLGKKLQPVGEDGDDLASIGAKFFAKP